MRSLVVIACLVVSVGASGCAEGTLDNRDVQSSAGQVHSLGAEGGLLAGELNAGRVPETFAKAHAADLADLALKAMEGLEPGLATPDLRDQVARLSRLAEDISVQLRVIEETPDDVQAVGEAGRRLSDLGDEAERIEGRL